VSSTAVQKQASVVAPAAPLTRVIPVPALIAVTVLGVVAGAYFAVQVATHGTDLLHMTDLAAYQVAAERVVEGTSVYDSPLFGSTRGVFEFVYTPFSALLFTPLAALYGNAFTIVGTVVNIVLMLATVLVCTARLGYRRDLRLLLFSVSVTSILLWCEPIRETVAFGQINILLLAMVVADLAMPDSVRWKGALVGIAAGIKLTPAFFVLYLVITRRFRAAAVAAGSFAATVGLGFLLLPKDSGTFWSGAFMDPARVGVPENPGNESLRGLFARTFGLDGVEKVLWAALAVLIVLACLALARRLSLTGYELPAVVLCGLTTTVVSPHSWVHHWVWLAPLLVYVLHLSMRRDAPLAWFGLAVLAVVTSGGVIELFNPKVSSVLTFPSWHGFEVVYQNAYIWLTLILFAVVAAKLRQRARMSSQLQ
jgi:alpha-1,2-mannosyltransferase